MTEEKFITKHEAVWSALLQYNERLLRKGHKALSREEIRDFAVLFRQTGHHLAYAQTHYPNGAVLPYLNRLMGVAHNYFYVRETGSWSDIKGYGLRRLPEAIRCASLYFWIAAMLFFAGTFFACVYVAADPANVYRLLPENMLAGTGGESVDGHWDYPLMSAAIMTNNIRVSIMVFALGITAGIGSALLLLYNGLIVGALAAFIALSGDANGVVVFLSLILPHGILELSAIFLSGACGLMIGKSLLLPGMLKRKDAVIKSAKEAAVLVPGIVLMLIVAGLIEGFFTPLSISPYFKLLFAGLTLAGLLLYGTRRHVPIDRCQSE